MENSSIRIQKIDIDGRIETLGIDDEKPVIHFEAEAVNKNSSISAYQVVVVKEENSTKAVWDTGKVKYEGENFITYEGAPLESKTGYLVQLTLWDEKDHTCETKTIGFETGFLSEKWKAGWIEPVQDPAIQEEQLPFIELIIPNPKFWGGEVRLRPCQNIRKFITVEKTIKKARCYASAHGVYNLYLNGQKQSNKRLAPENSAYQGMLYYQTYDVTKELKTGENELSVALGDGWWIGRLGMGGDSCNYGDTLGLILQLEIEYEDGTKDIICSDSSFESSVSHICYSDLYIGEKQDLTKKVSSTFAKEAVWENCKEVDFDTCNLVAQPIDSVCVTENIPAKSFIITPKKELVIDFGQVVAGVVRMTVRGKNGQKIALEHGEVLDKEGNYLNNIIGRNKDQKDVFVLTDGECTFEPQFTYHGFRYVRVTGLKQEDIISAEALVMGTPIQKTGDFSCSDERLNQLQHCIEWSTKGNMFSVPTDCPQREKLGWTGDIQVYAKTASFNYDMRSFLKAWLSNMRIEQNEEGEIPVVVPNPPHQESTQRIMSHGSNSSSVWGDACILVPLYLYEAYGDASILKENFKMMQQWMKYIKTNCEVKPEGYEDFTEAQKERNPYLWTKQFHFGDWLIPSLRALPDGVDRGTRETAAVVGSSYYAYTAKAFAKVCRILGENKLAEEYECLLQKIKAAVCAEFVAEDGIVNDSNLQGLYVMILACEIVDGELKQKVLEKLVSLIRENGYCLDTGFSSVSYLLDVLSENGYLDVAYKLLYQTDAPGWLYMVENGATTMWENWLAITRDGTPTDSSYNHYAFGCVGDWIYRHIGGIQMLESGYKKVRFAPDYAECGLTESHCRKQTPYGLISLDWEKINAGYAVSGIVPMGVSAEVWDGKKYVALDGGTFDLVISA